MAMIVSPGTVGTIVFFVCKVWMLALPLVWLLWAPESQSQPAAVSSVAAIEAERKTLDATVFSKEVEAQRHEGAFIKLWDDLRRGDPFAVFSNLSFESIRFAPAQALPVKDWGLANLVIKTLQGNEIIRRLHDRTISLRPL